jgi:MFS family permease
MYLPVPLWGYMVDRYTPRPASLLSAVFFGSGYILAAFVYRAGPPSASGYPFPIMVLAFILIGLGTVSMYISAVTTCAKNFGRGRHKGFALAMPIAAFGLSGLWQSQIGSRLLYERLPNGRRGDVDLFQYFIFLAVTLSVVGLIGGVALKVVNEEELIDDAVEELERSGLLEDSAFFEPLRRSLEGGGLTYGTMSDRPRTARTISSLTREAEDWKSREEEERRKKTWLLNGETRRFLGDSTMWWLAAGFFLVSGPGEAFINNVRLAVLPVQLYGTNTMEFSSAPSSRPSLPPPLQLPPSLPQRTSPSWPSPQPSHVSSQVY